VLVQCSGLPGIGACPELRGLPGEARITFSSRTTRTDKLHPESFSVSFTNCCPVQRSRRMSFRGHATPSIPSDTQRFCMRIIKSEGKVNIFNLAKNAGTSVDQIERIYARNLPPSKEMARNLRTFAD
jgi:hypothetical protein